MKCEDMVVQVRVCFRSVITKTAGLCGYSRGLVEECVFIALFSGDEKLQ